MTKVTLLKTGTCLVGPPEGSYTVAEEVVFEAFSALMPIGVGVAIVCYHSNGQRVVVNMPLADLGRVADELQQTYNIRRRPKR